MAVKPPNRNAMATKSHGFVILYVGRTNQSHAPLKSVKGANCAQCIYSEDGNDDTIVA